MTISNEKLAGFSGSDKLYKHWTGNLYYTEGVKYLADEGDAHWLLDCIGAAQINERIRSRPLLQEIQFWTLLVRTEEATATLTCREDRDIPPTYIQIITFTEFPLPEVRIWVEKGMVPNALGTLQTAFIAMLPNER